jgi:alpha-glucosidase
MSRPLRASLAAVLLATTTTVVVPAPPAEAAVQRVQFTSGSNYLTVELLDDDLAHFELAAGTAPSVSIPISTSPQVDKHDYDGPSTFSQNGSTLTTADMRIEVDTTTLCVETWDITKSPDLLLHDACPRNLGQAWKGLELSGGVNRNAYGLGQQFFMGGSADGDWVGRTRTAGGTFGNAMVYDTDNGPVGNTQIPVLFALGGDASSYGFFLDNVYKQQWDLTGSPWTIEMWGDQVRWYTMTGPDIVDVRADYLELTGRPPVPPKKALGLWMSEFGYNSWSEIDAELGVLQAADFPTDGFVLDLQWFGGVTAGSDDTAMGSLTWDTAAFPNPAATIAGYEADDGLGIIAIEESYIGRNQANHQDMDNRGYLVRAGCSTCAPVYLTANDWWGRGGMIDWTQPAAADYWHDAKRSPLIGDGLMGHWLDLGEPEMYDSNDWVAGVETGKHAHADYHNLYNLLWADGIARGYERNGETQRPFMLARSGAAGMQRHGVAMWSADIGSKLSALAAQQNTQMHMSMSGIDYYGSDIGGFRREMLNSDLDELYTQWFANGAWFEVPVRPHTEDLCECNETNPAKIGDVASNRANIRQRYELTPYYYSLAHRAHEYGEPVIPPLVHEFPADLAVREMGHEKMIGQDILVAIVAGEGERQRDVYLPSGTWIDYHTNERITSAGEWIRNVPLYRNGIFRLPAYVRADAILPKMHVDEHTLNVMGARDDNTTRDELIARVYAAGGTSTFNVYEDDGATVDYQAGAIRTTPIALDDTGATTTVTVGSASGSYTGAPTQRDTVIELVVDNTQASAVTLNGSPLPQYPDRAAFDAAASGWFNAGSNLVIAKAGASSVATTKIFDFTLGQATVSATFACDNGTTVTGQSVYVLGNVPELGQWSPASAVKLEPTSYPSWTATIDLLPPNTNVEWKCIKRQEDNYPDTADLWEPGANNTLTTPASGWSGNTSGSF